MNDGVSAATEAMHEAIASACGMDIRSTAARVIDWIETQRDRQIASGTDAKLAFLSAYETAGRYLVCGEYAWKLVNQHFGTSGKQPVRS